MFENSGKGQVQYSIYKDLLLYNQIRIKNKEKIWFEKKKFFFDRHFLLKRKL